MAAEAVASAKINLALHVTGRRPDGYHLLDSIVVFAATGDTVTARPADDWSLSLTGPFAKDLPTAGNLVLDAARLSGGPPALLTLHKELPVASGIGGGSADAAATLHALAAMDGRPLPADVLSLGADVPVCLHGRPARMSGIGDRLNALPPLPDLHLCLVNPGVAVSTSEVFRTLLDRDGARLPDPDWSDLDTFLRWLGRTRNDLEPSARALCPAIDDVLAKLRASEDCRLARMSGSGATCFGLYATASAARNAARAIRQVHPDWWVVSTALRD